MCSGRNPVVRASRARVLLARLAVTHRSLLSQRTRHSSRCGRRKAPLALLQRRISRVRDRTAQPRGPACPRHVVVRSESVPRNDSCQVEGSLGPSADFLEEGPSHSCCSIHLRWNDSCQVEGPTGPSAVFLKRARVILLAASAFGGKVMPQKKNRARAFTVALNDVRQPVEAALAIHLQAAAGKASTIALQLIFRPSLPAGVSAAVFQASFVALRPGSAAAFMAGSL